MRLLQRIAAAFGAPPAPHPATAPLVRLLQHRPELRAYVAVAGKGRERWRRVLRVLRDGLALEDGTTVGLAENRPFVVAYPSGEVMDHHIETPPWPEGLFFTKPAETPSSHEIQLADLADGNRHLRVTFAPSPIRPEDPGYFATTLTNIGAEPLCVTRFAAYRPEGDRYRLSTITRTFFTEDQFIEWYGAPADGWISPVASVCDLSNYGRRQSLWAYGIELRSGRKLVAGALVT